MLKRISLRPNQGERDTSGPFYQYGPLGRLFRSPHSPVPCFQLEKHGHMWLILLAKAECLQVPGLILYL